MGKRTERSQQDGQKFESGQKRLATGEEMIDTSSKIVRNAPRWSQLYLQKYPVDQRKEVDLIQRWYESKKLDD